MPSAIPRATDVRIVCATNRDPQAEVVAGRFREDLFYRLHVVPVELPPLRERPDDIPLLAQFFLKRLGEPSSSKQFTPAALCELAGRAWPGNVRELRNAVTRAISGGDDPEPDVAELELQAGDRYLICSDGLSGVVPPDQLINLLSLPGAPADACRALIDAANANGGPDNITVVVIDVA